MTSLRRTRLVQPRIDGLFSPKRQRIPLSLDTRTRVLQNSGMLTAILEFVGSGELYHDGHIVSKQWLQLYSSEKSLWRRLRIDFGLGVARVADLLRFANRFDCLEELTILGDNGVVLSDIEDSEDEADTSMALNLGDLIVCLRPRRLRKLLWIVDCSQYGDRFGRSLRLIMKKLPALQRFDLSLSMLEFSARTQLADLDARFRVNGEHKGECRKCLKAAPVRVCDGCGLRGPAERCTPEMVGNRSLHHVHGYGAVHWCCECATTLCFECSVKSFCPVWRRLHPRQAPLVASCCNLCRHWNQFFDAIDGGHPCSSCDELICGNHKGRCWRRGCKCPAFGLSCRGNEDPLPAWSADQARAFAACCSDCREAALASGELDLSEYDGRTPPREDCPIDEFRVKFDFLREPGSSNKTRTLTGQ